MSFIKKAGGFLSYFILSIMLVNLFMAFFLGSITEKIPSVMGKVYDYSSTSAKDQLNQKFSGMCEGVKRITLENKSVEQQILEQCSDQKKAALKQMCDNIDMIPENQRTPELYQTCQAVTSGEFDKFCEEAMQPQEVQTIDYSQVSEDCKSLIAGEISNKDFFVKLTENSISGLSNEDVSEILESNNDVSNETKSLLKTSQLFLNTSTTSLIIQGAIILVLLIILRLSVENKTEFLGKLSKAVISLAVLILLPFVLLQAYFVFSPPDTDPFINAMTQSSQLDTKESVSIIFPLVLDAIFTSQMLIAALGVLSLGIILKIAQIYS